MLYSKLLRYKSIYSTLIRYGVFGQFVNNMFINIFIIKEKKIEEKHFSPIFRSVKNSCWRLFQVLVLCLLGVAGGRDRGRGGGGGGGGGCGGFCHRQLWSRLAPHYFILKSINYKGEVAVVGIRIILIWIRIRILEKRIWIRLWIRILPKIEENSIFFSLLKNIILHNYDFFFIY